MAIKVLIVDDSALVRNMLTRILEEAPGIEVVGTASDPYDAREKIKKLDPDVLTLDVEMPKMDGITFLSNLMRLRPMPVVMVSSMTEEGAEVTMKALELGAVDFVSKPAGGSTRLAEVAAEIVSKVKAAARANVPGGHKRGKDTEEAPVDEKQSADVILPPGKKPVPGAPPLLAIGASTGGTEAIKEVLIRLPGDLPGLVITQHIPPGFSAAFARRMDRLCAMTVVEAEDGQPIEPGHAYVAPGSHHLVVRFQNGGYFCHLDGGPRVNRHKPSVDVLFRSVAQTAGPNCVAAILTGMGDDGARCLLELKEVGARTIAQDEATSVVWGMPGSAVKLGAAEKILPLEKIPGEMLAMAAGLKPAGGRFRPGLRAAAAGRLL